MEPVKFKEVNVMIAENQDEYITLPAYVDNESSTFCFKLTEEEIKRINETGVIWMCTLNGRQALQPINLSTVKEELIEMKTASNWVKKYPVTIKEWTDTDDSFIAEEITQYEFELRLSKSHYTPIDVPVVPGEAPENI